MSVKGKGIIPLCRYNPFTCRGDRIRTCDHLVPNQARYRAALHPEYVPSLLLRVQRYVFFLYPASFFAIILIGSPIIYRWSLTVWLIFVFPCMVNGLLSFDKCFGTLQHRESVILHCLEGFVVFRRSNLAVFLYVVA